MDMQEIETTEPCLVDEQETDRRSSSTVVFSHLAKGLHSLSDEAFFRVTRGD